MDITQQLFHLAAQLDVGQSLGGVQDAATLRHAATVLQARETALINIPSARFDTFLAAALQGVLANPGTSQWSPEARVQFAVLHARLCLGRKAEEE